MSFNLIIMKKILFSILLLTFIGVHAQQEKSLLWKISKPGLEAPSYLYGTIHATCDTILGKNVYAALKNTRQLYLELDLDDPQLQSEMMKDMNMKNGVTLDKLASKEDYEMLSGFMENTMGVPLKYVPGMKPFFISAMFIPKLLDCPVKSVEEHLMKITKSQDEEVFGLETVADQMAIFETIPYQDQMDALVKSAKDNLVSDKKEFQQMLAAYQAQDLNALLEASKNSSNDMLGKYEDVLLKNRNQNWIPKISRIAKEKPTFFGVGAAHLGGPNGVIALLRKEGFKVEAVK